MAIFEVTQTNDNGLGDTAGTLSWAILQANTQQGDDTIVLKVNVTVTEVMKRLINSNITITGDDPNTPVVETHTISGSNQYRPLFVKSGTVNLNNLTLTEGRAEGGSSNLGGGGAGMGGALFIYDGTVTTDDVAFISNIAQGGSSDVNGLSGIGGGGMFGNSLSDVHGGGLFVSARNASRPDGDLGNYGRHYDYGDRRFGYGGRGSHPVSRTIVDNDGGFGGGGYSTGSKGGFGGGDGGYLGKSSGNGGAGMGGAIFIRSGFLKLSNTHFLDNSATGGTGVNNGLGLGGAIFAMTSTTNPNGNNQGMPTTLPTVKASGFTRFTWNEASNANVRAGESSVDGIGENQNSDHVWGTITESNSKTFKGKAVNGYIQEGTVFLDTNFNGISDVGEIQTTSDRNGQFQLSIDEETFAEIDRNQNDIIDLTEGRLVTTGGMNSGSELPYEGILTAPAHSEITRITPFTSLVERIGRQLAGDSNIEDPVEAAKDLIRHRWHHYLEPNANVVMTAYYFDPNNSDAELEFPDPNTIRIFDSNVGFWINRDENTFDRTGRNYAELDELILDPEFDEGIINLSTFLDEESYDYLIGAQTQLVSELFAAVTGEPIDRVLDWLANSLTNPNLEDENNLGLENDVSELIDQWLRELDIDLSGDKSDLILNKG